MVHPRLGALRDKKDPRDIMLRKIIRKIELPPVVDYESSMSPIKDQFSRGACVSFASIAVKEWQEKKQRKTKNFYDFSEEWVYSQIRQPGGGAFPRDAFKLIQNSGVCREHYLSYQAQLTDEEEDRLGQQFKPSIKAKRNAAHYKAEGYARLTTIEEMKQSLASNGPFMIGVDWLDGWFDPTTRVVNQYPILEHNQGSVSGGHAIAVCGYDTILIPGKTIFKFKQSWNEGYGRKGYAYFSQEAIEQNIMDAWASFDFKSSRIDGELAKKLVQESTAN